jgi:hypothetical protein
MEQYIDKTAVVAEINRVLNSYDPNEITSGRYALVSLRNFLDTLEVKEVDIASMADDYYDALMEETADWMDEGTIGHCRLAYYHGCKDVLNKIQKGE